MNFDFLQWHYNELRDSGVDHGTYIAYNDLLKARGDQLAYNYEHREIPPRPDPHKVPDLSLRATWLEYLYEGH